MSTPTIAREAAGDATVPADVVRLGEAIEPQPARDAVAVEEPLEIHLNGWRWLVTMRTPGADTDLVLGLLASEGAIAAARDVESVVFRRHPDEPDLANVVDVRVVRPLAELQERLGRNAALSATSCGLCGASSVSSILQRHPPVAPGPDIDAALLAALPERLAAAQPIFAATGGLHAAALFTADGTLVVAREDVGRHNAVDKVLGWRLRADPAPATPVLLVSGRASFEIVQKALAAAIPIVAAVSAPSSLAVMLAEDAGMTLAGFVRAGGCNLYAGHDRVRGAVAAWVAGGEARGRDPDAPGADPLDFMARPLRAALDEVGCKIALADWRALTRSERRRLVTLVEHASREDFAAYLVDRVTARTGTPPRRLERS